MKNKLFINKKNKDIVQFIKIYIIKQIIKVNNYQIV